MSAATPNGSPGIPPRGSPIRPMMLPPAGLSAEDLITLEYMRVTKRMERLRTWVRHFSFGKVHGERRDALWEVKSIREDLIMLKLRIRSYEADSKNWDDCVEWVRADKAETTNELFTSMSKVIPMHMGETPDAYYQRLRDIRKAFADLEVPTSYNDDTI